MTVRKWNIQSSPMINVEILLFAFGYENIICVIILYEYKMGSSCCFVVNEMDFLPHTIVVKQV